MPRADDRPRSCVVALGNPQATKDLRIEAESLTAEIGKNSYSEFLLKNGRRPDRTEAATIGRLLGRRVRAADGTLQPKLGKMARDAARDARRALEAEMRIDAELSRALDAVSFLAKNEIDPSPLIARISPVEAEALTAQIEKAVLWLNRFANGWLSHVNIGTVEIERPSTGNCNQANQGWPRLVRSRD